LNLLVSICRVSSTISMSTLSEHTIRVSLLHLARNQQYRKGLRLIAKYSKKLPISSELLLNKAFFLYHNSAKLLYGHSASRYRSKIDTGFHQATIICNKIIKSHSRKKNRYLLNARLYLAQIYVMNKQYMQAIRIGQYTHKIFKTSMTAERLADIYQRARNLKHAIQYYREGVRLAKKPVEKLIAQIGVAISFKELNDTKAALKEASIAYRYTTQAKKGVNLKLLQQSLFAHFPELNLKKDINL